jgi:hypothetical protein
MPPEHFSEHIGIGEEIPMTQPENDSKKTQELTMKKAKKRASLKSVHPSSYLTPKKTGRAKKKPKLHPPEAPPRNRSHPAKLTEEEMTELQMRDSMILSELTENTNTTGEDIVNSVVEISREAEDVVESVVSELLKLDDSIGPLRNTDEVKEDDDEVEFVKVESKQEEVECVLVINGNKN